MAERRKGLGRGLGALIPTQAPSDAGRPVDVFFPATPTAARDEATAGAKSAAAASGPELVEVPGASFAELPVGAIRPNPRQPRRAFDIDALAELAASIREVGLLQPIVVRPLPKPDGDVRYELIMGERRWRATQAAELDTIPAIIRQTDQDDLLRDALLENLHRADLNPLEEAAAYQQLLDDFSGTQDELARRVGKSRSHIANTLRLLKLPSAVQQRLAAGVLSAGHARALLALGEADAMERLGSRIVAEGLSVRITEEIVALGGEDAAPVRQRRPPRPGMRTEEIVALQDRLADRFDTRVTVSLGQRKGKVVIEFASVDDLNRILATLAPEDPGLFR